MSLVLSADKGEQISLGLDTVITVIELKANRVRLAFDAPDNVTIRRHDVIKKLLAEYGYFDMGWNQYGYKIWSSPTDGRIIRTHEALKEIAKYVR